MCKRRVSKYNTRPHSSFIIDVNVNIVYSANFLKFKLFITISSSLLIYINNNNSTFNRF
jgi:hypothetical protein